MKKFYCDRCGEEIKGEPSRMFQSCYKTASMYIRKKLVESMKLLADMDFCENCLAEIVDFARNKNVCDECVQQMADENAMLRESAAETGSSTKIEQDPDEIDRGGALERIEKGNFGIHDMVPVEEIARTMRSIRQNHQCQSGQS